MREADQILVVDGRPDRASAAATRELLAAGGVYADLYETQFASQEDPAELTEDPLGVA